MALDIDTSPSLRFVNNRRGQVGYAPADFVTPLSLRIDALGSGSGGGGGGGTTPPPDPIIVIVDGGEEG